ncbi:MAG: uracil-DNA glycosylase [Acidobacteria bacterium]|nr:uracil-DNA glycosylase [Acidobacteriota bacterium]
MTDREQLEAHLQAHLEFFRELGVEGVSRDPVWRRRAGDVAADVGAAGATAPAGAEADAAEASEPAAGASPPAGPAPPADVPPPAGSAPPADVPPPAGPASAAGVPASSEMAPPSADVVPPLASGAVALSMFDRVEAPADGSPPERLAQVREQLGPCTRCKLHSGRTTLVFGVGNPDADLMFVGEAPGRDEDREGIPFVGRAGQLLTRIIEAIDLRRDDVYIANVIKCRPPDNRNPEPDEVQTCEPYLFAQIDCIRPRVIVALGSFAARTLLRDERTSITRVRGKVFAFRGAQLIPTFHPAFLLRSPDRKREVWEDMKLVRSLLRAG